MQKEKTAMQMLIENIDARLNNHISDTLRYSLETCRNEAVSLIQKEQEQIEMAFYHGRNFNNPRSSKDYYQSKYGGESL